MTWTLTLSAADIPWRSGNARGSWHERHAHTSAARLVAAHAAKRALEHSPAPACPVSITVTYHAPDLRLRDPEGCAQTVKPCIDGLVDAGVLPDDNWKYVDSITYRIIPRPDSPAWTIELETV